MSELDVKKLDLVYTVKPFDLSPEVIAAIKRNPMEAIELVHNHATKNSLHILPLLENTTVCTAEGTVSIGLLWLYDNEKLFFIFSNENGEDNSKTFMLFPITLCLAITSGSAFNFINIFAGGQIANLTTTPSEGKGAGFFFATIQSAIITRVYGSDK